MRHIDELRLAQMVKDHRSYLVRVATLWTRSRADAEDVVQVALEHLVALTRLPTDPAGQRAVMLTYCRYAYGEHVRWSTAEKRGPALSLDDYVGHLPFDQEGDLPRTATLEETVAVREALDLVREALRYLTHGQRVAVIRAAAGWAMGMAEHERTQMGASAFRGRQVLAAYLQAHGYAVTPHHNMVDRYEDVDRTIARRARSHAREREQPVA